MGLIPNPDGYRLKYDKNLERKDIRPGVERILNNIKSLLDEAGGLNDKYVLKASQGTELVNSKGLDIFKSSFERFKGRIRKHQKDTSTWKVTKWAIHDAEKFQTMIDRLEKFVDGLESITKSLGLLQEQHARLREEIDSIPDVESLRLLRDASSHASSQRAISDTASHRLTTVSESLYSASLQNRTIDSFYTAPSRPSARVSSGQSEELQIPGSWPKFIASDREPRELRMPPLSFNKKILQKLHLVSSRPRRYEDPMVDLQFPASVDNVTSDNVPQNRRVVSKPLRSQGPPPLTFANGDECYGERLALIKKEDEAHWYVVLFFKLARRCFQELTLYSILPSNLLGIELGGPSLPVLSKVEDTVPRCVLVVGDIITIILSMLLEHNL